MNKDIIDLVKAVEEKGYEPETDWTKEYYSYSYMKRQSYIELCLIQRWFRNLKILVEATVIDDWNGWTVSIYHEDCIAPICLAYKDNSVEFPTYDAALLAGLQEAVKLISK